MHKHGWYKYKYNCINTVGKNTNTNVQAQVVQRVVFLHEDLVKLPSFPRKVQDALILENSRQ